MPLRVVRIRRSQVLAMVAVTLSVALTSCASYRAKPINLQTSAQSFAARTLHNPRLVAYLTALGLPPGSSWGFRRLTYVAVFERPTLKVADAKYRIAFGKLGIARQIDNPTVGISTGYNATALLPTPWSVGPILSFLVQNFYAKDARVGAAHQKVLAARQAVDSVAWHERKHVYHALLTLWSARRATALYRQKTALDRSIARAVEERYQSGTSSATAVTTAEQNAEEAAFHQHQEELKKRLAQVHLAKVIGLPPIALKGVAISYGIFGKLNVPKNIAADEHAATVDRPAVKKALAEYNAAQFQLKVADRNLVNGLNVAPGFNDSQRQDQYALSIQASAPIFNQHGGQIAVARASRRLAAAQLKSVQEHVFDQIERANARWRKSRAIVTDARQALRSAKQKLAATQEAYRAGTVGAVRLLGRRQLDLKARTELLSTQKEYYGAIGDLMAALHKKFWKGRNDTG